jgi:EAL domain-containing protein (putative c-di-GMP-specific phosphodiesterase class I)
MISPGEFIPLAEKSGLILPLGEWVMGAACMHLAQLAQDPATAHLTVAVNVSVHQIRRPDFVVKTVAAVERHGIDPRLLKLELTESVFARDMDDLIAKMKVLKEYGVSFSLDDFGTGYSSLAYLSQLPVDVLKIDRTFIKDLPGHNRNAAIVRAIIELGSGLELSIVAEGVETEAQRQFLLEERCHLFQGFLLAPALPGDTFLKKVRTP